MEAVPADTPGEMHAKMLCDESCNIRTSNSGSKGSGVYDSGCQGRSRDYAGIHRGIECLVLSFVGSPQD